MTMIKTWQERCEEHPDHEGIVTERMIHSRMQEEIDELRQAIAEEEKREWVGLREDEIFSILENLQTIYNRLPTEDSRIIFAQAIEAKLKEKNT